jgi:hypothetical protein
MAATYPSGIYAPREKENKSGVVYNADKKTIVFAEDLIKLDEEVVAVETELGQNPSSRIRAFRSTPNQTIPTTEETKVQFNAEDYDRYNEYDITTNHRFTALGTGYYIVQAQIQFDEITSGTPTELIAKKNGAVITRYVHTPGQGAALILALTDIIYLSATDYIEIYCYHECAGSVDLVNGTANSFLAIHKLSA